jgi:FKBP-type peptidyl-prolyl cis-trans isomerase
MKPSDKARIIMPSWLSNYVESGVRTHTTTAIYDLELVLVVPDIAAFQTDSLKQYSVQNFGGTDSLKYDWYFISTAPGDNELPLAGDTIKIRYAGYFLDGFLFDTNIESVAESNYGDDVDKSATYAELTVIMDDDVSKMSVVAGFAYALQRMSDGEEATTFFSSDYGYGTATSGQIQPYSMLRFDMEVTIARKVEED